MCAARAHRPQGGARSEAPAALPDTAAAPPEAALSARQVQILTLVAQGLTYRQVADHIGLAERTVKYHMAEILARLHLENRAQVIAYAARTGLARPGENPPR